MRKILRQSDEKALGGGNPTTQWRRRKSDADYAEIWFDLNGRPACFADERDAYWENVRSKGYSPKMAEKPDSVQGGVQS